MDQVISVAIAVEVPGNGVVRYLAVEGANRDWFGWGKGDGLRMEGCGNYSRDEDEGK